MKAQAFYHYGSCAVSTEMELAGMKPEKFMNITDRCVQ